MSKTKQQRWASNAAANIFSGVVLAIFNLLTPAMLSRKLTVPDFAIWSLALQVVIYLQIFMGGLQTAIAQKVAFANEKTDHLEMKRIAGAAFVAAGAIASFAMFCLLLLSIAYPILYPKFDENTLHQLRINTFVIGFSFSFQLLALFPAGVFMGTHKNIYWAFSVVVSRALFVFVLLVISFFGWTLSLFEYAICFAVICASLVPVSYGIFQAKFSWIQWKFFSFNRDYLKSLLAFSAAHSVWGVSMLLVGGATVSIVANFDYPNLAPYTMAITLMTVMVGLLQAMMSPMVPALASAKALPDGDAEVKAIFYKSTKRCVILLLVCVALYFSVGENIVTLWAGKTYGPTVFSIGGILAISYAIRNFCIPMSMCVLGLYNPQLGMDLTLLEGGCNIFLGYFLALNFGVLGVAYASLISSTLSFFMSAGFLIPRLRIVGKPWEFIKIPFLGGILSAFPIVSVIFVLTFLIQKTM
ncbi:hypothetical protein ACO0K7_19130 [Undibacterium sp. Ji67W]|uniref:hypothetical protein n=1 Tax=Undibacterium sp. Ji67W TaxID=3413042 RepID=UPI003BF2261D